MIQTRVIPILLLKNGGLYKTINFKHPNYIGDPRNAIKIFNEKEVDELCILDISATDKKKSPDFDLLDELASECFMPLSYGGGITTLEDMDKIFSIGIEKVVLNSVLHENLDILSEATQKYGDQSIVVSIDVKKTIFNRYNIFSNGGKKKINIKLEEYINKLNDIGVGEIIITSINNEGMMKGMDTSLVKSVVSQSKSPVVAVGGIGDLSHISEVIKFTGVSAVGVGSFVVYHGKHKAVLITYPDSDSINKALLDE